MAAASAAQDGAAARGEAAGAPGGARRLGALAAWAAMATAPDARAAAAPEGAECACCDSDVLPGPSGITRREAELYLPHQYRLREAIYIC